ASGPRHDEQRELIASSIAPVWEANHVWLIVAVVMFFTAFPAAFGAVGIVLHLPLTVMLLGVVLRGSAFVFRSYGGGTTAVRRRWGLTFAVASVVTPFVLGVAIGTVASGAAANAFGHVGDRSFVEVFVSPWLDWFPLSVGALTLALFAFLAAVYLAVAATDDGLRDDFRKRALVSAVAVFLFAALALVAAWRGAPQIMSGITQSSWALVLHLATAIAAITAIVALWTRRFALARLAAGAQVSLILWGWALAQFPFIVPPTLSIRATAAPDVTLELLVIGVAVGAAILIPSLRFLFRLSLSQRDHAPP
ncbi:MAG TPA: cytochrome d ubiquinol oxidase subunit II, partial [Gemmatimonadaceae bacterium]|nr:cytochrome d ubiquinol oxidase subunit II [Gemmatimonadaceae bacterium]